MKIKKYSNEAMQIVKEIQKRFVLEQKEKVELLNLIDEIIYEGNKWLKNKSTKSSKKYVRVTTI